MMDKTCYRCGSEFQEGARHHLCPTCRTPVSHAPALIEDLKGKRLSYREKQLCHLISQGKLNKEIAWELKLTIGTVKTYISRVFVKLDCRNRTEVAVRTLIAEPHAQ